MSSCCVAQHPQITCRHYSEFSALIWTSQNSSTVSPLVVSDLHRHIGKLPGSYSSMHCLSRLNSFIPCVCTFTYLSIHVDTIIPHVGGFCHNQCKARLTQAHSNYAIVIGWLNFLVTPNVTVTCMRKLFVVYFWWFVSLVPRPHPLCKFRERVWCHTSIFLGQCSHSSSVKTRDKYS